MTALEVEMEAVAEGVANFRAFQKRAGTFFDKHEAEVETERRQVDLRHAENQSKIDATNSRIQRYGIVIAIFSLICAICMVIMAVRTAPKPESSNQQHHTELPSDYYTR